jgi:hypothetical protein
MAVLPEGGCVFATYLSGGTASIKKQVSSF